MQTIDDHAREEITGIVLDYFAEECDVTKDELTMETNIIDVAFARYRCEECGAMIHAG